MRSLLVNTNRTQAKPHPEQALPSGPPSYTGLGNPEEAPTSAPHSHSGLVDASVTASHFERSGWEQRSHTRVVDTASAAGGLATDAARQRAAPARAAREEAAADALGWSAFPLAGFFRLHSPPNCILLLQGAFSLVAAAGAASVVPPEAAPLVAVAVSVTTASAFCVLSRCLAQRRAHIRRVRSLQRAGEVVNRVDVAAADGGGVASTLRRAVVDVAEQIPLSKQVAVRFFCRLLPGALNAKASDTDLYLPSFALSLILWLYVLVFFSSLSGQEAAWRGGRGLGEVYRSDTSPALDTPRSHATYVPVVWFLVLPL